MATLEPPWSHPLVIAELPPEGAMLSLAPGESERAALARHIGVLAMPVLSANIKATPDGNGGLMLDGDVVATVRQTCVVSLEPFDNKVNEHLALRFLPEGAAAAIVDAEDEGETAESIKGGVLDLGEIVAEFLALGVDPYPRRPGAVFAPPTATADDKPSSPFAALAKLKPKGSQED